jgi:2-polyprenyl-3-methyl-5-hydroxy-6-metoxy-1,4-benzoquinol methylase
MEQVVPNPVWTLLDTDLHLQTLKQDYAPVGLLEMISEADCVLDVGCFCGGTGRWLKQKFPSCKLTGIEMLEKAAGIAAPAYDNIIVGRFEEIDFGESGLEPDRFNTIIAADFLEHLINPWKALQRLKPLLNNDGAIYISIPNVRNLNLLANLATGSWSYAGAGIQDITHLRFFTRSTFVQMLTETGWVVDEIRVNPDPRLMAYFAGRDLTTITTINAGSMTLNNLTHQDVLEYLALQFFARAHPAR